MSHIVLGAMGYTCITKPSSFTEFLFFKHTLLLVRVLLLGGGKSLFSFFFREVCKEGLQLELILGVVHLKLWETNL